MRNKNRKDKYFHISFSNNTNRKIIIFLTILILFISGYKTIVSEDLFDYKLLRETSTYCIVIMIPLITMGASLIETGTKNNILYSEYMLNNYINIIICILGYVLSFAFPDENCLMRMYTFIMILMLMNTIFMNIQKIVEIFDLPDVK